MTEPQLASLRVHDSALGLDPSLELGAGGEARVFAVPGDRGRVAKIFRDATPERARKIARMIEHPPHLRPDPGGAVRLAWPQEAVVDAEGRPVGFLMARAEGPRVFEFYNPATRRAQAPLFHYGLLHRTAGNLAAAFAALHERGYVVGDVNESNILVAPDGAVTLVDTDGFQVPDPAFGVYRARMGRPEFTPPELQGVTFGEVDRTAAHDRFGLCVLLFLLLMEGTHPFAMRVAGGATEPPPLEGRIRAGMFPYAGTRPPRVGCMPPRLAIPFEVLHPEVRALFERCFVDGHLDPAARPAAAEWRDALRAAEEELRPCGRNRQHRFGGHLNACPWCARAHLLHGRDPFPATVEAARQLPARLPRAPAAGAPHRPPPSLRPHAPTVPQVPLSVHATAAIRKAVRDPALYVLPLLLLAVMPLGVAQLFAAIAALGVAMAALQPRPVPRSWGTLAVLSLLLTLYAGSTAADLVIPQPPVAEPPEVLLDPTPPPNPGRLYEMSEVDVAPYMLNHDELMRDPALQRRPFSVSASYVVDTEGRVAPGSLQILELSDPGMDAEARKMFDRLRHTIGRVRGWPVQVRVPPTLLTVEPPAPGVPATSVQVGTPFGAAPASGEASLGRRPVIRGGASLGGGSAREAP